MAQAFRSNNRPDPRLDVDGKMCFILQEQYRGYRNQDGSRRKQKALPMSVLRKLLDISFTSRDQALAWLLIGAIFFAMRSCEYLATSSESKKRTRIIRLKNISFKKNSRLINHADSKLDESDLVRIQFEYQKNDKRDVSIHMFKSGDKVLCPIIAWARTVQRVRKIPNSSDNSQVCLFKDDRGTISLLNSDHVRSRLRSTVELIGEDSLGFNKDEIGLHSIRSGGAMAMFLSGTSPVIIQRVGRWSSDAFLEYIREQVETFTLNVSKNMLQFEEFSNLKVNNNTHSSDIVIEPNDIDIEAKNENGLDLVPFTVKFSKLSLDQ